MTELLRKQPLQDGFAAVVIIFVSAVVATSMWSASIHALGLYVLYLIARAAVQKIPVTEEPQP